MNIQYELKDTLLQIDIEIANTKDIVSKASLIASKVKVLELLSELKTDKTDMCDKV